MRIHVINPNTTASMTKKIGVAAKAAASPGVEVRAVNPDFGPRSIEGYFDEAFPCLACWPRSGAGRRRFRHRLFRRHRARGGALRDGGARHRDRRGGVPHGEPCRGEVQRRYHSPRSIAPIERNLVKYGLAGRCGRVRASNVPVLALEEPGSDARRMIEAEIKRALAEDGAEAIVLGCAGMTDLVRELERSVGAPVLDGVACAVSLAESLVRIGLRTSKRNTYAPPLAKAYAGEFAKFSPR
jgi:allantoin racemase